MAKDETTYVRNVVRDTCTMCHFENQVMENQAKRICIACYRWWAYHRQREHFQEYFQGYLLRHQRAIDRTQYTRAASKKAKADL